MGLGSNLGRPRERLAEAVRGLDRAGFRIGGVSSVYRSAAVADRAQPDFENAVVVGRWPGGPKALLILTRALEAAAGRVRPFADAPRTLDLDLLLARGVSWWDEELVLPHPRWRERSFVLAPLAEVAPLWRDPRDGRTVHEVWDEVRARLPPVHVVAPPEELWRTRP